MRVAAHRAQSSLSPLAQECRRPGRVTSAVLGTPAAVAPRQGSASGPPAQAARLHVRHVVAARAARRGGVRAARRAARARAAAAAAAKPPPPVLVVVAVRARVRRHVVVGRVGLLTCSARGAQSLPPERPWLQHALPAVRTRALHAGLLCKGAVLLCASCSRADSSSATSAERQPLPGRRALSAHTAAWQVSSRGSCLADLLAATARPSPACRARRIGGRGGGTAGAHPARPARPGAGWRWGRRRARHGPCAPRPPPGCSGGPCRAGARPAGQVAPAGRARDRLGRRACTPPRPPTVTIQVTPAGQARGRLGRLAAG